MKINLDAPIKKLNNEHIKNQDGTDTTLAEFVANQLANHMETGANGLKFYDWATRLFEHKWIELNRQDLKLFETMVPMLKMSVLVQGQVIERIDEAKEAAKKED